jgi:hypothetical protein
MLQHLVPLGLMPALLERVVSLGAARGTGLEVFCDVLAPIAKFMSGHLSAYHRHHTHACAKLATPKGLLPALVEQLLSSPAALDVVLRRGLAADVRAAASAGSTGAMIAMDAVSDLFGALAGALNFSIGNSFIWDGGLQRFDELARYLQQEESLPYLELLCMPLPHREPRYC